MRTKTRLAIIAFAMVAISSQFISCKKDSVAGNKVNSNVSTDNSTEKALKNGLVAWYTFNGDILDHSGNNNNIDFNSATPAAGKKGVANTAYFFDGGSSYMTVPNSTSLNPASQITLAALVKPTGFYQGPCHRNTILYKAFDDNTPGHYLLAFDDMAYYNFNGCNDAVQDQFQNFYGSYGDGQATGAGVRDAAYLKANKWYTVVFTYDGISAKLYVNRNLRAINAVSTTFTPSTAPVYIGGNPGSQYPYLFTGVIDELRIYNKALSVTEVQKLSTLNN